MKKIASNATSFAWLLVIGSVAGILLFGAGQRALEASSSLISAYYYLFGLAISWLIGVVLAIGWCIAVILAAKAQSRQAGWILAGGAILVFGIYAIQWPSKAFGPPSTPLGSLGPWLVTARVNTPNDYQPFSVEYSSNAFPGYLEPKDKWTLHYQGQPVDLCKAVGSSWSCNLIFVGVLQQSPIQLLFIERTTTQNRFWRVRDANGQLRLALLGEHDFNQDASDCQINWFEALGQEGEFFRVGNRVLIDQKTQRILPLCAMYSNRLYDYPVAISPDRRWVVFGGYLTLRVADLQKANPYHALYQLKGTNPAAIERAQWRDFWTTRTGDVVRSFDWDANGIKARAPYALIPIAKP